jgi:hypothetical protein
LNRFNLPFHPLKKERDFTGGFSMKPFEFIHPRCMRAEQLKSPVHPTFSTRNRKLFIISNCRLEKNMFAHTGMPKKMPTKMPLSHVLLALPSAPAADSQDMCCQEGTLRETIQSLQLLQNSSSDQLRFEPHG